MRRRLFPRLLLLPLTIQAAMAFYGLRCVMLLCV